MPQFSKRSQANLETCKKPLQDIFNHIVKYRDITILEGHRGEKAQNEAYSKGFSKLKFPHGNHNKLPSNAVDVSPYPMPASGWANATEKDLREIVFLAGLVYATAEMMGYKIRWGGDWDGDFDLNDNKWDDLFHFELVED